VFLAYTVKVVLPINVICQELVLERDRRRPKERISQNAREGTQEADEDRNKEMAVLEVSFCSPGTTTAHT
jgi:hypothetical protein